MKKRMGRYMTTVRKIIWVVGLLILAMFIFVRHNIEAAILRRKLTKL